MTIAAMWILTAGYGPGWYGDIGAVATESLPTGQVPMISTRQRAYDFKTTRTIGGVQHTVRCVLTC